MEQSVSFRQKKKLNCFYYTTHKSWPSLYFVRCSSTAEMVFHDFLLGRFFVFVLTRFGDVEVSGVICESFWDAHLTVHSLLLCVCVCRCLLFLLFYAKVCTNDLAQFQYAIHTLDCTKSFGLARMQARKHWTTHEYTACTGFILWMMKKKKWKIAGKKTISTLYIHIVFRFSSMSFVPSGEFCLLFAGFFLQIFVSFLSRFVRFEHFTYICGESKIYSQATNQNKIIFLCINVWILRRSSTIDCWLNIRTNPQSPV